ncbi:MAG: hypothetical protein PHV34_09545 [Verrucomicrobiae bacterium]|nr:hypothetical protein [Verrucomicrobiae bacterium]
MNGRPWLSAVPWRTLILGVGLLVLGFAWGWFARGLSRNEPVSGTVGRDKRADPVLAQPGGNEADQPLSPKAAAAEVTAEAEPVSHKGVPRSAREVLEKMLAELEAMDPARVDVMVVAGRLQQLKDFGEEGSQAAAEFLRTQQDISFNMGMMPRGRGLPPIPSLRAGLIDLLGEMNDPVAQAASLEVVRGTASGFELMLAARNLERREPGSHREEILKAMQEIINSPQFKDPKSGSASDWMSRNVVELAGYYQSKEALPRLEEMISGQPRMMASAAMALAQYPAADQAASLQRIVQDGKAAKQLAGQPWLLARFDLRDAGVRQTVQTLFSRDMNEQQREQVLSMLGNQRNRGVMMGGGLMRTGESSSGNSSNRARIEGALRFLDEISPSLDSQKLRQQLENVRGNLQKQWNANQ